MKIVYIAGPYRADCALKTSRNISRAEILAKSLLKERPGYFPLTPHLNTALWDFSHEVSDIDPLIYLEGTLELLRRCDAVLVVTNYESSRGTIAEISEAVHLGIPVYYSLDEVPVING